MQGSRGTKDEPSSTASDHQLASIATVHHESESNTVVIGANKQHFYCCNEDVTGEPLEYKACGLDGIYLLNGYVKETDETGTIYISVNNEDGLNEEIGKYLVLHRKALGPKEIKFLRKTMNLTQTEMADHLGNNSQSVARWEKGECDIPGAAEKLLRLIYIARLLSDEDLATIRSIINEKLRELDKADESAHSNAKFSSLGDKWSEQKAA